MSSYDEKFREAMQFIQARQAEREKAREEECRREAAEKWSKAFEEARRRKFIEAITPDWFAIGLEAGMRAAKRDAGLGA